VSKAIRRPSRDHVALSVKTAGSDTTTFETRERPSTRTTCPVNPAQAGSMQATLAKTTCLASGDQLGRSA
jgi:hypothetical protein